MSDNITMPIGAALPLLPTEKTGGFTFSLSPVEEASADLVNEVGKMFKAKATEPGAPMFAAGDRRISRYANLRLSDMAELALILGCTVKVSLEPSDAPVPPRGSK